MGTRKKGGRYLRLHSHADKGEYRIYDLGGNICDCHESCAESLVKGTFVVAEVEPVVFKVEGGK